MNKANTLVRRASWRTLHDQNLCMRRACARINEGRKGRAHRGVTLEQLVPRDGLGSDSLRLAIWYASAHPASITGAWQDTVSEGCEAFLGAFDRERTVLVARSVWKRKRIIDVAVYLNRHVCGGKSAFRTIKNQEYMLDRLGSKGERVCCFRGLDVDSSEDDLTGLQALALKATDHRLRLIPGLSQKFRTRPESSSSSCTLRSMLLAVMSALNAQRRHLSGAGRFLIAYNTTTLHNLLLLT